MAHSLVLVAAMAFGADPAFDPGSYGEPGRYSESEPYRGADVSGRPVTEFGMFDATGFGGQLYPFDGQEPWLHGYVQEIPAYGGFVAFRPYNYKHVLSQSQTAAGWGLPPTMPYSQQFWHRYHGPATMSPPHPYGVRFPAMPEPPEIIEPTSYRSAGTRGMRRAATPADRVRR